MTKVTEISLYGNCVAASLSDPCVALFNAQTGAQTIRLRDHKYISSRSR
jgi:hypothetical protein